MKTVTTLICALPLAFLVGCSNMTPSEQSVLSGSALGAVGGAALGALSGHAGEGALIGAGIGAVGGAMQNENNRRRGEYTVEEYEDENYGDEEYVVEREYHHYR